MYDWLKKHKYFLGLYVFFVLVTQIPFHFPSSDQSDTLPVIMHNLDPAIFSEDFHVNASQGNNYRMYFIQLMTFLGKYLSLKFAFLLMTLIVTFFSFLAVYFISLNVFGSQRASLLAVFLSMFLPGVFSLFNQQLIDHNLLPRSINVLFLLWSLFFYLQGRPLLFWTALILSVPFHMMQTGYFVFGLLFSHLFVFHRLGFPIATSLIFIFTSFLFFWPSIVVSLSISSETKAEIFDALAVIRNPNLASIFHLGWSNMVFQLILVCFFLATCLKKKFSLKERQLLWIIPGVLVLVSLQYVLVDFFHNYYGAFFYSRSLIFLNFVLILFIADYFSRNFNKSRAIISSAFLAVLFSASAGYKILLSRFSRKRWLSSKVVVALVFLLALLASHAYFCLISSCFDIVAAVKWWSPFLLAASVYIFLSRKKLASVSAGLIIIFIAAQLSFSPVYILSPILDALRATPQNSVFLAPPELANEILFLTHRSVVFNWDVLPSNPEGVREWRNRLLDLTNNATFPNRLPHKIVSEGYDSLSKEQILSLAGKYNADFVVSRKPYECPIVKQGYSLYLYNISACVTSAVE